MDEYGAMMDAAIARNKEYNASQVETGRLSKDGVQSLNRLQVAHGMLRDKATSGQQDIADSLVSQMDL